MNLLLTSGGISNTGIQHAQVDLSASRSPSPARADLLPSLREVVYVALSAGSMVIAPNIGEFFVKCTPPSGSDEGLGLVDFAIFPHLDHEKLPHNTQANAEKWAARVPARGYAIDDQTAIRVAGRQRGSPHRRALEAVCPLSSEEAQRNRSRSFRPLWLTLHQVAPV
jgi:peptidase S51-like protein